MVWIKVFSSKSRDNSQICEEKEGSYYIKGTNDAYCEECALEHFGALDLLESAEQRAESLKKALDDSVDITINEEKDEILED